MYLKLSARYRTRNPETQSFAIKSQLHKKPFPPIVLYSPDSPSTAPDGLKCLLILPPRSAGQAPAGLGGLVGQL
jgi:hypothetical protein